MGVCPLHCKMFASNPGFHWDASSSTPPPTNNHLCPQTLSYILCGDKTAFPPVYNHCSNFINGLVSNQLFILLFFGSIDI
jgi:hypothetical protein